MFLFCFTLLIMVFDLICRLVILALFGRCVMLASICLVSLCLYFVWSQVWICFLCVCLLTVLLIWVL